MLVSKIKKSPVETRDVIHMRKLNFLIGTTYPILFILGSVAPASLRRLLSIFSKPVSKVCCNLANIELTMDLCIDISVLRNPPVLLPRKRIANIQTYSCLIFENIFLSADAHLINRLVNGQLINSLATV